jgi:branched-chain amino acid transport system permease protein
MAQLLQYTLTGLAVGMIYALIALGFALIWKSSRVANLALGQLVLISSWFAYSTLVDFKLPIWAGMLLTILFAIFLGWMIERFTLRPMIGQPILSLIAVTLGIGYFLEGVVTMAWPISIARLPDLFPEEPVSIGTAVISQEYLWAAGISVILFILLSLFFKFHKMGIAMRASADDQLAVQACAVPITSIFSMSWIFACVVAAIGGILISSIGGITNALVETGFKSFSVVILGGLDSFIGCMVAGPIIGLCENVGAGYLTPLLGPGIKELIPFVIIIIVMLIRPYGLFGEERIERI